MCSQLQRSYVFCLEAFSALCDIELDGLAFLQAAEAACLNRRKMYENVIARLAADKAVALGIVKPLYCSLFHFVYFCSFVNFTLEGVGRNLRRLLAVEARTAHDRFGLTYRLETTLNARI